ncbi:MAG: hypothetical protein ACOCYR_04775 [Erythrobacter sp.]|uniref:hypothetical protein n=1 Tax=Erythrobacter sp. HL-111 TaxID=1798193 RepID=UPI0006DA735B|nr:hypothetical protein [Erythrobacter sp. HL-111]KPP89745.1 MAG: Podoplanin [Erythrobacteraceae bacterium HL-111]SDT11658.1 hypothetical protein SAMN04515621_2946 [Erythrobacter sp. HL-111]
MKFRNIALATAAVSLAASPAIAEAAFDRSIAPIEGESEVAGGSGIILAVLAAAAIIGGIVIAADGDDDDAVSP